MLSIIYRIYLFNFGISVYDYRMQENRIGENKMANEITDRGEILLYSDENGREFVSVVFKEEQLMSMPPNTSPSSTARLRNISRGNEHDRNL